MVRGLSLFMYLFFSIVLLYYCFLSQIWFCTDKTLVLFTSQHHPEAKRQARLPEQQAIPEVLILV